MRVALTTFALTALISMVVPAPAMAGGWSGDSGWQMRSGFSRGYVLKPLWDRVSRR